MIIQLSKDIYKKSAIDRAVLDYAKLAHFIITESETHYYCKITHTIYDSVLTAKEFENYIIGIMNQKNTRNQNQNENNGYS